MATGLFSKFEVIMKKKVLLYHGRLPNFIVVQVAALLWPLLVHVVFCEWEYLFCAIARQMCVTCFVLAWFEQKGKPMPWISEDTLDFGSLEC